MMQPILRFTFCVLIQESTISGEKEEKALFPERKKSDFVCIVVCIIISNYCIYLKIIVIICVSLKYCVYLYVRYLNNVPG